jgi:hypothetical protein
MHAGSLYRGNGADPEWSERASRRMRHEALQTTAMTSNSTQRTKEGLVYQRIKALLVGHAFAPGEKILAHTLADRLGVSGTPVREALIRLQAENFLSSTPNRGFFFKPISLEEMADLYRFAFVLLRNAVEAAPGAAGGPAGGNGAAGNGATVMMPGARPPAAAAVCVAAIPDAPDPSDATPESYAAFIEELFLAIVSMSESRAMIEVLRNIMERTRFIRRIDLELPGHFGEIRRLMTELIELLQTRNTAGALRNLESQMRRQIAVLPDLVKEGLIRSCST